MTAGSRAGPRVRSGAEWAVRIVLALLLALLGVEAGRQALAAVVRTAQPRRAHILAPRDGRVLGQMAQALAGPDASPADRREGDRLATLALREDPTVLPALVTLGLHTQLRGDATGARRIFTYAEMLSRRDLGVEVWAIEDAVGRGDIASALRHYDIALRTSRQAPDLLFPVLGSAIGDPDVRSALAEVMARGPRWNELFIPYVAGNGADPLAVVALFRRLAAASVPIPPASQAIAVARLIDRDPGRAWAYYAAIRPGAERTRSRDPRFTLAVADPAPFDWTPAEDANLAVSLQPSRDGGIAEMAVPPGVGGVLLSQLQYLPPGEYELRGHSADIAQAPSARPYWRLGCERGRELGQVVVPNSAEAGGRFVGRFSVPADCAVQRLSLVARPSEAVEGLVGRFDEVRLQPVGGTRR